MKPLRAALIGLALLPPALAVVVALGGLATVPAPQLQARIAGLAGPVHITLDTDGVPRLRAGSDLDAATGLGFVHARDRLFQMELGRRIASGRLAEIAGSAAVDLDVLTRTLGLRARAEQDLALLPPHTRAMLDAYSRGVNAWMMAAGRRAAPEFLLMGRPEPWTAVDCLLWGKTMALYLSGNYRTELTRLALERRIHPDLIRQQWPIPPPPLPPDAAADIPWSAVRAASNAGASHIGGWVPANRLSAAAPPADSPFGPPLLPATESNEWAVDGAHSATGAPLLAGDPHLAFSLPAIWYLARIDTPAGTLAGATAPGIPFLVIGHNARVAWTFTTTGADTQDVFIETQIDPDHYQTPDGPRPYLTHDETIHVLGGGERLLHIRATRHGPVISDISQTARAATPDGQVLAVAMAALAPADTAPAGLDALNRAGSLDAALAAAPLITSPVQNLLAADAHAIGLAVTGRVPIRAEGDGTVPVDGASGRFDWTGFATGRQLPRHVAPASGRLVNANEPLAGAEFPVLLGHDAYGDWRARRIRQLLDAQPRATVDGFVAMQADTTSLFARQVLPALLRVRAPSALSARALALLAGWDGRMDRDHPQPLIFNAWIQRFALLLLDHAGIPISEGGPRLEFLAFVLGGDGGPWCDGDCAPMLAASLDQSTMDLERAQGGDPQAWRWGPAHRARFAHPLLGPIPLLGLLGTRSIEAPGDDATIDRGGMAETAQPGFDDVHGAAYRGVYDLADLDRSRFMLAPGQSGNLFSPHAADLMRRWRDGQTLTLGPTPSHIGATILLEPAGP